MSLLSTKGLAAFTSWQATRHLDFPRVPIDRRVVGFEPGEAQNEVLFAKARDGEEHPFRVGVVLEDYVSHFRDFPSLIWSAVHIENRDRVRQLPSADSVSPNKVLIDEAPSCSRIQQGSN